jgi:endonuclease YncB( thermonuclease family)
MRIGILFFLFGCTIAVASGVQFTARVIAVLDGDTIMVLRSSGPPVKVRLADIDAPEKEQPGGVESTKSLSELVMHKQVRLNTLATDIYGRLVAHLTVDGKSVNEEQVRRGMAWEYSYYHDNKSYIALQSEAQQAQRGLWSGSEEIMKPVQWRKLHAKQVPVSTLHAKPSALEAPDYTCGSKRLCSQMLTCDEAYYYLSECRVKSLDPNRDGVPCEHICGGS